MTRLFHARMISVLWSLFFVDLFLVAFAIEVLIIDKQRMGIMIMFASEFMILTAGLWSTIAKYAINCHDMRSEEPWEAKSMYVSAVDLVTDFLKLATYVCFFCLILTYYGLPLNIVRDVYVTARSFFGRIRDLIRYRAATRNMDTRFPNATHDDLRRTDGTCIICRDEMVARGPDPAVLNVDGGLDALPEAAPPPQGGLNDTPKKLACGHIFHFHCLRAWLERQQSCPTCRRTVFETAPPQNQAVAGAVPAVQVGAVPQQQVADQQQQQQQEAFPDSGTAQRTPSPGVQRQDNGRAAPGYQREQLEELLSQALGRPAERSGRRSGASSPMPPVDRLHANPSRPGQHAHASGWVPPAPNAMQDPQMALPPWLQREAARASSTSSLGPTSPQPTNREETTRGAAQQDSEEHAEELEDPRAAARAAALRRFASSQQARPGTRSVTTPAALSHLADPSGDVANGSSEEQKSSSAKSVKFAEPTAPLPNSAPGDDLDTPLTEEELHNLTLRTRRGIQEQLRVLSRAQNSIFSISTELTKALSALPPLDENGIQGAAGGAGSDEGGVERPTLSLPTDSDDDTSIVQSGSQDSVLVADKDKGKGKAPAEGLSVQGGTGLGADPAAHDVDGPTEQGSRGPHT